MKISFQIRLLSLLLLFTSIWFWYLFVITSNDLDNRRDVNRISQSIIKATFEFNIITNEYLNGKNERIIMQWKSRHDSLEDIFYKAEDKLIYDDDKLSLKKIIANEVQIETFVFSFDRLMKSREESFREDRQITQLVSQIQVRIHGMLSEASRMSQRSSNRLEKSEESLKFNAKLILFFLWPVFIFSFLMIDRKVIKPITDLQKSAEQLSSGKYDTKIEVHGNNEVSALARSYNHLANEIQKKITSLTDKSMRLDDSQKELIILNENLKQMVDDQTTDLRNSENRQRAILESMHDGVITLDEEFIIKNINPATTKMFGYAQNDIIGKSINHLISYLPGHKIFSNDSLEASGEHKNGDIFPVEMSLDEMEIDGVKMYSAIIRDITERRRSDKLKTEFVGTVSHELRTPLTAIRGSLGLVNSEIFGVLPPKSKELLETASRNTERLLNLINDILDIQKIEAGKMEFHNTRVDLMDLIEKSIIDNKAYSDQFSVEIILRNKLDNIFVFTDPHRLAQVLANLLSNASKFSPKFGKIFINAKLDNRFVDISVEDSGEGIPLEFQDKIFAKFSQNDSSTTRQKGGTGLGLAITKQMVEIMEGNISFTSTPGKGTIFHVFLPVCE